MAVLWPSMQRWRHWPNYATRQLDRLLGRAVAGKAALGQALDMLDLIQRKVKSLDWVFAPIAAGVVRQVSIAIEIFASMQAILRGIRTIATGVEAIA